MSIDSFPDTVEPSATRPNPAVQVPLFDRVRESFEGPAPGSIVDISFVKSQRVGWKIKPNAFELYGSDGWWKPVTLSDPPRARFHVEQAWGFGRRRLVRGWRLRLGFIAVTIPWSLSRAEIERLAWNRGYSAATAIAERVRLDVERANYRPAVDPDRLAVAPRFTNLGSAQPCGCDPGAGWICEQHRHVDGVR